jgi:hypothetical protein
MRLLFGLLLYSSSFLLYGQEASLDRLIDDWHKDAAIASFDSYFSVTTADFIFLGTAPGERWVKEDFKKFCKPYFDKGKAWDFKPLNRKWSFSEDHKTAWFDEDLKTWMEDCRATGICVFKEGKWNIAYYNLHVLIENEKIQEFISLRKEK